MKLQTSEYYETAKKSIDINIDFDDVDQVFELITSNEEMWLTEKELNQLIKQLQIAKKIYKTRRIP